MKIDRGRGPVTMEDIGINAPTIQGMPTSWGSKKGRPLEAAEGVWPGDAWILDFCPQAWEGTFCCQPPGLFSPAAAPANSHSW